MLSTLYAEDKRREKALFHANRALSLAPKDPWMLADIAETYDDLGDRKRGIQYAQDSLKYGYTLTDLQRWPALGGFNVLARSERPARYPTAVFGTSFTPLISGGKILFGDTLPRGG